MDVESGCPVCAGCANRVSLGHNVLADRIECPICGEFIVTRVDRVNLGSPRTAWNRRHGSALVREQFIRNSSPFWLHDGVEPGEPSPGSDDPHIDIAELLRRWPRTVPERIDRTLCNLARLSKAGGASLEIRPDELSVGFAEGREELDFHLRALGDYKFLTVISIKDGWHVSLTPQGWERFEKLTHGISAPENPVFVAMWFPSGEDKGRMNAAYDEEMGPAVKAAGYRVTRVDLEEHNDWIMDRVLGDIRLAPFVVADCSGHRNGVYFEAGFARGLAIPVIHTCQADDFDKAHFDTKQLNHIVWTTPRELRQRLYNRILGTLGRGPHAADSENGDIHLSLTSPRPPGYFPSMPRTARAALGGVVYHVLNRGNGRMGIFRKPGDYQAFLALLVDGKQHADVEVFGFCLMPNHWHLVLRPRRDRDLAGYLSWVSNTHVKRYRAHYPRTSGHLYQGRYKSFPVEEDSYLLSLLRYVESNPIRCRLKLADRAQDWQWSSLGCDAKLSAELLSDWPLDRPRNWTALANQVMAASEQQRVKASFDRGRPLGTPGWTEAMARRMGLDFTLNPRGRPKNAQETA
jgi:putative transposase